MSAVVIITGGGGFLGQCLASAILKKGSLVSEADGAVPLSKLILADIAFPPTLQPTIVEATGANNGIDVEQVTGDVSSKDYCDSLYAKIEDSPSNSSIISAVSVFHLGAVMSGDGERDFDLCLRVNLHGCLNMLEGARHHVHTGMNITPKFMFASAGAIIGSGAPTDYIQTSDTISDATRATPHTTYGATKACCELLLSDYARRGFVNGRALRLPTIAVRAGKPNAATTGCYSAVIREPLAGTEVVLPIAPHVQHAITSARAAMGGMMILHDTPLATIEQVLGYDRTVFLPAQAISLDDLHQGLLAVTKAEVHDKLGKIRYEVDQKLSDIVGSFPTKIDARRALNLGIPPAPDAATMVREYIEDFSGAVQGGLDVLQSTNTTEEFTLDPDRKVAVVTGGGSGIGQGVAKRLVQGGYAVVLAGRNMATLKETHLLLEGGSSAHLCVRTDVTSESDVRSLFAKVEEVYGRCDLLFNNAGINRPAASFEDVPAEDFEAVLKTNVTGPFLCAKYAMQVMKKHGGGRIINNGSISAHTPRPGSACYTASKHAMVGLTKCLALDGRAHNVACGQIDFGNVVSKMSLATNKVGSGALQPNGTHLQEASMSMEDACETVWAMVNLPLDANVLQMTVMATTMPFVGRG